MNKAERDYLVDKIELYGDWAQIRRSPIGRMRASAMRGALSLMADKFGVAYEKEWRVTKTGGDKEVG